MTRQQRRNAERRLSNLDFPFPEFQAWLRGYLRKHPECYAQARGKHITTNLSGATEELNVSEFRVLLERLKLEGASVNDDRL